MSKIFFSTIFFLILSLTGYAQDIYVPDSYSPPVMLERTPFQKGMGVSTDVTAVALPIVSLTGALLSKDWEGAKQFAFSTAATVGVSYILKYTVRESRPDNENYHSFPSFHSSLAFSSAAFLQRRYGWKFGAPAYALATYTAVGRVLAKKHHWWDCVAGAAIGVGSAYIFTTPWAQKHEFAIAPAADDTHIGFAASLTF